MAPNYIQYDNFSVMIRRRSTMDHSQRIKHNKLVEMYGVIDLCLQLSSDDRILIRNQVKAGDQDLVARLNQCKKDKNYHQLQIYLRKYVLKIKENEKYGIGFQICKNSRGKTPQTLKSTKNPTDSSYHNSRQNSFQSSPSAKKTVKLELTKQEVQDHPENEFNPGLNRREITPREIKVQIRPLQLQTNKNEDNVNTSQMSMKNLLKAKISQRINRNMPKFNDQPLELSRQLFRKQDKQNEPLSRGRAPLTLSTKNLQPVYKNKQKEKQEEVKYGEFYKRIRKVIEQAY